MTDQEILRELASAYMEAANEPVNAERRERAYATNGLQAVRPLVWIHELPWHELNIDDALTLRCEGALAREIEQFLRRSLLQWRYFQADMILEPYYPVSMCIHSTGIGFQVIEEVLVGDDKNNIISHSYKDQLDSLEKLEILHNPVVTRDYDEEKKRVSDAQALLGDAMPVKLCPQNMYYYAPWDRVCRMRGMTPLLMDLAAEPELMHATIQKFSSVLNADIDALNAVNAFGVSASSLHCTPPYSRELEAVEAKEGPSVHSAWFRALAQPFGEVSPPCTTSTTFSIFCPSPGNSACATMAAASRCPTESTFSGGSRTFERSALHRGRAWRSPRRSSGRTLCSRASRIRPWSRLRWTRMRFERTLRTSWKHA